MAESLQQFVENVNGTGHLRVEHDFGDGFVRLQTSEAERRQAAQDIRCSENIILELLRNSRDAHASHVFVAMWREGEKRMLTVLDDGCGIPAHMHKRVFEPRVTSKLDTSHMDAWGMHGRGMALFSIAKNSEEARIAWSAPGLGSALSIVTDTTKLPEKRDQSSFPTFELSDDGTVNVRGPRNIVRTVCEFAIESRSTCSVYVGSPSEVAATLHAYGMATLSAIDRLFCKDVEGIGVCKRFAAAADSEHLAEMATAVGLPMSSRTARRILDGEICELDPVLDGIRIASGHDSKKAGRARKAPMEGRMLRLSPQDSAELAVAAKDAFARIAEAHYLDPDVEPTVRARRDRVVITIPAVHR